MKQLIVDEKFWEIFPEANIKVLVLPGLDNQVDESQDPYFEKMLAEGKRAAAKFVEEEPFTQNQVIKEWREAFSKFKTKKGARSSIEALLKRVAQDRDFRPINPLVDIYNSVSLEFGVPCGGEDLGKIAGNLHLGKAQGGESFWPLGAEADAPALPEEIIYYDQEGAVCRSFNWREAQRTMLTEATKDAVMVIEAINEEQALRAEAAINKLVEKVQAYFKVEGKIHTLSKAQPSCEI